MQTANDRAEAVVSWPAMRKVISWLTRPSSVKPPDSIATERMFLVVSSFLLTKFSFSCCTREWQVFLMTCDAASKSSLRLILFTN